MTTTGTPPCGSGQDIASALTLSPRPPSRALRILVAEDQEINQDIIVQLLQHAGHAVDLAQDGAQAVALATQADPAYDLILMDWQMPVLDGLQATRRIRDHERIRGGHTRIVALTGHLLPQDRVRCLEAGMDGHLGKPVDPQELMAVLGSTPLPGAAPIPAPATRPSSTAESAQPQGIPAEAKEEETEADYDYLRALDAADATVLSIIAPTFRNNWPERFAALRAAAQAGDAHTLNHGAHALRGVAGNFGPTPVQALARRVEQLGAEGRATEALALLPQLEAALQALDQALLAWLTRTNS
jgi:CheY-like chemotaxis protein